MSVSNQTDKIYGSGNGVTTTFSFLFKIFDSTQLVVYLINATTSVATGPLILNTDYTVSISSVTEGGTVTFTVAPPIGMTWFIKRTVPYTQAAVIPSEGALPGKQIENQLDLITMMVIQDQEAISRCIQAPVTSLTNTLVLPNPLTGYALGWDINGNIVNIAATSVGGITIPIVNSNLATLTQANLVNGSSLFSLSSIPSGAGALPTANLPVTIPVGNLPTGVLANNVLKLDGSAKIPAVDGSQLTNVGPNITKALGAWDATHSEGTIYQAATDGFVVGFGLSTSGGSTLAVLTDSASTPTTTRTSEGASGSFNISFCVPVKKNDYWKVDNGGRSTTVYWIPLGS